MIKLVLFFIRSAKNIKFPREIVLATFLAGVMGGVANTTVLAIINRALSHPSQRIPFLLPFAAICLALSVSRGISQVLMIRLATGTVCELRVALSKGILSSPLRHLEKIGQDRLLATFTDDIPAVMAALMQAPTLCINGVIVVGCLLYIVWLSWKLFLLVIISVAVGMAGYHFLERRSNRMFRAARDEANAVMKNLRGLMMGQKELQMHRPRREEFLTEGIIHRQQTSSKYRISAITDYAIAEAFGETILYLVVGLLLFVFSGLHNASTAVLTGYVLVFLYMINPLQFILNVFPTIGQADVAIDRIEKLNLTLMKKDKEVDSSARAPLPVRWQQLELRNVTHTYHNEKDNAEFTLGPINLKVSPGEMIFVTGGNGSGKTTLAKVLAGLYAPESGEVIVDSVNITDKERDDYRQMFSVVFCEPFLFDQLYGLGRVDDQANRYLSFLQLDQKLKVQNGMFSTLQLSQGQRKRLALLVAYLEDHPIFVFDEWAADQDKHFRDVFYYEILPELRRKGKAVIVVSHDDRYFGVADRVVRLEYGKLSTEDATPGIVLQTAVAVSME